MKICKVENCEKKSKAHGFCSMHNHRNNRYGNPLAGAKFRDRNPPKRCTIPDCNHKYAADGLCYMHYQRNRSNGSPFITKRNPDGYGGIHNGYKQFTTEKKKIFEHRDIMERHLGRKLLPFPQEVIHHIDGDKLNNHISNLRVMSASDHQTLHSLRGIVINDKKLCTICNEFKKIDCFYIAPKYKTGYSCACKECNVKKCRKYRESLKHQ